MKKERLTLLAIVSEIEREIENLKELQSELGSIRDKGGIIYTRSKGSILHDFYNCCERIFKKIAIEINEGYEETERWHKALLYRMTIPLKDIRPQVISEELAAGLDEYLAFRHLFRSIYGFELKGDRIERLAEKFEIISQTFIKEIEVFLEYLRKEL
jgi:hypothetical protein